MNCVNRVPEGQDTWVYTLLQGADLQPSASSSGGVYVHQDIYPSNMGLPLR